jgi:hypothetical protein
VQQSGGVGEFDGGGATHDAFAGNFAGIAAKLRTDERHGRTQALAARTQGVGGDIGDELDRRGDEAFNLGFDSRHTWLDGRKRLHDIYALSLLEGLRRQIFDR